MVDEEKKQEDNIGSFYMGRGRPQIPPKRFLPPGVLSFVALAALGGIIWYAYPRGAERYTNLDVPVVKADTAPIKAKPDSPGGMEVSHQDSTVFDPLQKNGGTEVEKLAPTPEQPMDKDQMLNVEQLKPIASSPSLPPKLDMQPTAGVPTPATPAQPAPVPAALATGAAEEILPPAEAKPPVLNSGPVTLPTPKPEAPKVAAAPVSPPVVKTVKLDSIMNPQSASKQKASTKEDAAEDATTGTQYEVQLGSYREEADAKKDWTRLEKKYAEQLSGLKMRLVKADIPGKGVYYRMRAGVISKDKAHSICDALKETHGVGCILAKR